MRGSNDFHEECTYGEVSEADEGDGGRDGSPQGGHPLYRGHHLLIGHSRVDVLLLDWRFSNNHCSTR